MIIAAVGKNASGKDYFLEYIAREFDIPMLSVGDIVRELAEIEGVPKTRESLHAVSQKYMGMFGQDFFPRRLVEKIKENGYKDVLISGLRPPSDVESFRENFGDEFYLVAIVVESDKTRWQRTVARGSERDHVTFEEFLELDKREERLFNVSKTISMADYTFYRGEFSDDEYHARIKKFFLETFRK